MLIDPFSLPEPPRRTGLRLTTHDYAGVGPYFVTICTRNKKSVLATLDRGTVRLTRIGKIVREVWLALPSRFGSVVLDEFVVMPNHVHGILALVGAGLAPPGVDTGAELTAGLNHKPGLGDIICVFKSLSTKRAKFGGLAGNLWQRGYYEHIIRDGEDMKNVQRYVLENPSRWRCGR